MRCHNQKNKHLNLFLEYKTIKTTHKKNQKTINYLLVVANNSKQLNFILKMKLWRILMLDI